MSIPRDWSLDYTAMPEKKHVKAGQEAMAMSK